VPKNGLKNKFLRTVFGAAYKLMINQLKNDMLVCKKSPMKFRKFSGRNNKEKVLFWVKRRFEASFGGWKKVLSLSCLESERYVLDQSTNPSLDTCNLETQLTKKHQV